MTDTKTKSTQNNKNFEHTDVVDSENDPFDYGPLGSDEPVELADGYVKTLNGETTPKVLTLPSLPTADCEHTLTNVDDPDPLPQWRSSPQVGCYTFIDGVPTDSSLYNHGVNGKETWFPPSIIGDGNDIDVGTVVDTSHGDPDAPNQHMERVNEQLTWDRFGHSGNQGFSVSIDPINDPEEPTDEDMRTCDCETTDTCLCNSPLTFNPMTVIDDSDCATIPQYKLWRNHNEYYSQWVHGDNIAPTDSHRVKKRRRWEKDQRDIEEAISFVIGEYHRQDIDLNLNSWSDETIKRLYNELETTQGKLKSYRAMDIMVCLFALHLIDHAFNQPDSVRTESYSKATDCACEIMDKWDWIRNTPTVNNWSLNAIATITTEIYDQLDCYDFPVFSARELWRETGL